MAIDRTVKWRCQWQGKNGWANMLEIIPAGDLLDGDDLTVSTFSRSAFEMDFAEYGFEDLPIGMMKAPAASFSFIWANLPSGLKELLKSPYYETPYAPFDDNIFISTTTLFTYWNDEGTGALILQYIGAQANTLGNKFEYRLPSGVFSCQIETFDLLKTIMDTNVPRQTVFGADSELDSVLETGFVTETVSGGRNLEIVDFSDDTRWKNDYPVSFQWYYLLYSFEDFRDGLADSLRRYMAIWTRSGSGTNRQTIPQTGYPDASLTFYKQTQTDAHTKGAALDETNTLILGHICTYNGSTYTSLGGLFSNDKEGFGEFDSLSTFIAALCENLLCKLIYKPTTQVNGVTGDTLLTYNMYWLRPLDSVTSPVTLTPKITDESYEIETAAKVFLIAESEIPNMGGDNINQNRVSVTVSDKNDVWNAKMVLHNLPTLREPMPATVNADPYNKFTFRINPRKLLYRDTSILYSTLKVHESVVISDGINSKTVDSPTAFLNENWYDGILDGWVIVTQQTQGLPQAAAEYITTYWGKNDQAAREFPCLMVNGEVTPSFIGDTVALPAVTEIGVGSNSVFLAGKPDWDAGIMDCKYLSLGA